MPTSRPGRRSCRFGPVTVAYDDRVLAPRAWTLAQSTWAAELARARAGGLMLELCGGAGHIGLAAAVLAGWDLLQVELDPVAAGYASANARRAGWARRVEVRTAAVQDALRADERFALIIADPPYLTSSAITRWPADPVLAIDGGPDGLCVVRACLAVGARHLDADGSLLLQVAGPAQAAQVAHLLQATPDWRLCVAELRVTDRQRAIMRVGRP